MKSTPLSHELLEDLLADKKLTPSRVDELIVKQHDEDQYLDYKDGRLLGNDLKKGRATVREYVSAFANSDGGVLVLGVDEPQATAPRAVTGCSRPGGTALDVWAQDCLADMAPYFSPQPRYQVVSHPKGEVLFVAVSRAPQFVPCVESRQIRYHLRMGRSTLMAPAYLISDLVLGRRQHPVIALRVVGVTLGKRVPIFSEANREIATGLGFSFNLVVENLSLARADEVDVGLVSWSVLDSDPSLNAHLASYIDVSGPPSAPPGPYAALRWRVQHAHDTSPRQLRPFGQVSVAAFVRLAFPWELRGPEATFRCAVYVMPKGSPPTWFELSYRYDSQDMGRSEAARLKRVQLHPTGTDRPRVSWECHAPDARGEGAV